MFATANMGYT
ncbi:Protein of unknown function [Bacillus cereus]|nr:Protein of unknown function [Bacillus cereus]SCN36187.1 Protein of unknown function [Bacillus wiedmannii]